MSTSVRTLPAQPVISTHHRTPRSRDRRRRGATSVGAPRRVSAGHIDPLIGTAARDEYWPLIN
jgi:hypothetical protein